MEPTTLSTQKSAFLTTQIRLLSSPLHLSSTFTSSTTNTDISTTLSPKVIEDLLSKVNDKLKSHNRLVFSAATQRHIVEQIESLYFADALADNADAEEGHTLDGEELTSISRDVDLTSTTALTSLPTELHQAMLDDTSDLAIPFDVAEEYTALLRQLLSLAKQRDEAREKLARYRKLEELLRPFEDVKRGVQGNLVTRDGEMAREMERMRVLVARVVEKLRLDEGGLKALRAGEGSASRVGEDGERNARTFDEKLRRIMEMG